MKRTSLFLALAVLTSTVGSALAQQSFPYNLQPLLQSTQTGSEHWQQVGENGMANAGRMPNGRIPANTIAHGEAGTYTPCADAHATITVYFFNVDPTCTPELIAQSGIVNCTSDCQPPEGTPWEQVVSRRDGGWTQLPGQEAWTYSGRLIRIPIWEGTTIDGGVRRNNYVEGSPLTVKRR